jgi:hypothetical protein
MKEKKKKEKGNKKTYHRQHVLVDPEEKNKKINKKVKEKK